MIAKSTDHASVIQAAIDALGVFGGKIFLKAGEYICFSPITLKSATTLEGENYPARWWDDPDTGAKLVFPNATDGLVVPSTAHGVVIRNLRIHGSSRTNTKTGIKIETNADMCRIEHTLVRDFSYLVRGTPDSLHIEGGRLINGEYGLYLEGGAEHVIHESFIDHIITTNVYAKDVINLMMTNNEIFPDETAEGIRLENAYRAILVGNCIVGGTNGIVLASSHACSLIGNVIRDCSGDGVRIGAANGNILVGNHISPETNTGDGDCIEIVSGSDNIVVGNELGRGAYGIRFGTDAQNTRVYLNRFVVNGIGPIYLAGTGNRVKHNIGYITENSGLAYSLKDGSFIPHGLVDTPTGVSLTCLNASYGGVPVIVSWNKALTNSTHIAVNIFWANGTAITDPVIAVAWRAEYNPNP